MSTQERKDPTGQIEEIKEELTPDQQSALEAMRTEVNKHTQFKPEELRDATLLRFLRQQSYNATAAAEQIVKYLQWRVDNKIDQLLDKPFEKDASIRSLIPWTYSGFDNDGRPIYVEKTGKIKCADLVNPDVITLDALIDSHIYGLESLAVKMQESSKRLGKRVDQFATILDMNGLGFHHRSALGMLRACLDIDYNYFPDRIGRIYVINTPWVAPYLYQAVQVFLDANTKQRVHIVSGDPKAFLPTVIPKESLPVEYGGTFETKELDVQEGESDDSAGLDTELVSYDFTKELECGAEGGTFNWYFKCDGGYDIDFSVEMQTPSQQPDDKKTYAKIPSRCVTNKGSYKSEGPCKLIFRWDNNFSYFTSKTVKYMVGVSQMGAEDEALHKQL